MILEGDAGSLSDVGELEWSFTLYDVHGDELLCFAFATEQVARTAHKMTSHLVIEAMHSEILLHLPAQCGRPHKSCAEE